MLVLFQLSRYEMTQEKILNGVQKLLACAQGAGNSTRFQDDDEAASCSFGWSGRWWWQHLNLKTAREALEIWTPAAFLFFCCCLLRLFCNKFGAMTWESWVGLLARSFLMQARYSLPLPPSPPAPSVFLDLFLRTLVLLLFPLTKWKWGGALCQKIYR